MSDIWFSRPVVRWAPTFMVSTFPGRSATPVFKRIPGLGEHLVLRFSGQKIDDDMLMAFSARFGDLDRVPHAAAGFDRGTRFCRREAEAWVAVISSIVHDGKPVGGLGSYELVWHTDMSTTPCRRARACLRDWRCRPMAAAPASPQHVFCLTRRCRTISSARSEGRTCIHDSSRNSAGEL